MPKKYIIGLVVVLILALAVWLVPLALAAGNGGTQPAAQSSPAPSQGSGTTHQCPAADPGTPAPAAGPRTRPTDAAPTPRRRRGGSPRGSRPFARRPSGSAADRVFGVLGAEGS